MRYVPVPYEALELIPRHHWHAVTDLYRRAHTLRWREFASPEKSLATSWGISRRQVRAILSEMQLLGLLHVTPGCRGVPTRICVFDPNVMPGSVGEPSAEPVRGPDADHVKEPSRPDRKDTGPVPGPEHGPAGGPAPVQILDEPEPTPTPTPTPTKKKKGELSWEDLSALWEAHDPGRVGRWMRSKGLGADLFHLRKHKAEDIALVLRWLRDSEDASFHREQGFATRPTTVRRHFHKYLDLARGWAASDRSYLEDTADQRAMPEEPWDPAAHAFWSNVSAHSPIITEE